MKAEFLKIAGVKSEAELYLKFPSEEKFMEKHGKAIKKLMAKKAEVGDIIPNIQTPKANRLPIRFDSKTLKNLTNERLGKPSVEEQQAEEMRQLQLEQLKTQIEANKKAVEEDDDDGGGIGNMIGDVFSMFGGQGGGSNKKSSGSISFPEGLIQEGFEANKNGGKTKKFTPHMMYDPKTGKGYKANKPADHERMKKLGYLHADEMKKTSKAQVGDQISGMEGLADFNQGQDQYTGLRKNYSNAQYNEDGSPMNFMQRAGSELGDGDGFFQKVGGKVLSDVFKFKDMFEAQKEQERRLEQQ